MADSDDLLSADEIEALIQASKSDAPGAGSSAASAGSAKKPAGGGDLLDPNEIEALMQAASADMAPPQAAKPAVSQPAPSPAESTLQRAESHLAAAMASPGPRGIPPELGTPSSFSYPELGSVGSRAVDPFPLSALQDVELDLRIELGRTELLIDEVLKLREGSVVPLDKLAGDPVDILVNGRLVARGEVLVLNDNFCVRVAEILTPEA